VGKTFDDLALGLTAYFLGTAGTPANSAAPNLTSLIETRFWDVGAPQYIALYESLQQEPAASHGQFVTFRDAGCQVGILLGAAESRLRFQGVELICYARFPADARTLREKLYACIVDNFVGTWGTSPAVAINGARWDYTQADMDFDETVKMTRAQAALLVPYRNE